MPLRTITLDDGKMCSRKITDTHPDGREFLTEEFTMPSDTAAGERVYKALERLLDTQNKPPQE